MMTTNSEKANQALKAARKQLTRKEFKELAEYLFAHQDELTVETELVYRIESETAHTIAWRGRE